jgi:hypothetical protein
MHDTDFLAFLIRLYYILILLLMGHMEDSKISGLNISFKTTFIALNDLVLSILSSISMNFNSFKAFANTSKFRRDLF